MKLKENDILRNLIRWTFDGSSIMLPNYFLGRWECDLYRINGNGFDMEYEVKTSVADFKMDCKKAISIFDGYEENFSQIGNGIMHKAVKYKYETKHERLLAGKRVSRFYFVVPENLIRLSEVPKGLGLIYATNAREGIYSGKKRIYCDFNIVRTSSLLKKDRVKEGDYKNAARLLTTKLRYRF